MTILAAPVLDIGNLVSLLTIAGLFTAVAETLRWFLGGRNRARVDNAKIVQGMAIDLLEPLHAELAGCRASLADLRIELDSVLGYAIIAHALLESPPVAAAVAASGRTIPHAPPSVLRRP